ncbi:MAG: protein-L-isoaspartate(D-aspartate) O-methyltransferase [Candidatus Vecturithrix sp.]|jgi:protein-L-isoaspartate(D-aspartate) O-methyltransferase|nr:protein-L-isoaspartate(D-aspartate) O-methyltransferase [Candidatus Vecturithrix sp.]
MKNGEYDSVDFTQARNRMVEEQLIPRGIQAPEVLAAMRKVPRHLFLGQNFHGDAYGDHPLPIGADQTISQPYMVALMTELLDVHPDQNVLEIGTGSGYQTAILAELAREVYTIERITSLANAAQIRFEHLHYRNIQVRIGDGTAGWKEHAPYHRILVTAGAPTVPAPLVEQLADGGKLVIPVGSRMSQMLHVLTKQQGQLQTSTSCPCVFVRLIGQDGWEH